MERLPHAYAVAVRMDRAGMAPDDIATALGIEPEGVATLLDVAAAKLRRLAAGNPAIESEPL